MSLAHLKKLTVLMPPLEPPPENEVNWSMAEDVFGITFPSDFKEFVHTYGNVIWCDLFRAIYPETSTKDACQNSKEYVLEILSNMFDSRLWGVDGKVVNASPYPSPEGLLPCLIDSNGCYICWHMVGDSDQWTTVKYSSGNIFFYPYDLTGLICNWIEQNPPVDKVWSSNFLQPKKYGIAR